VTIVTISRTIQDIVLVRGNRRMVEDLLAKGYTVDDVERLVYGQNRWNMLTRILQRCRRSSSTSQSPLQSPRPPVKMPA